jgi:hypothetical protein
MMPFFSVLSVLKKKRTPHRGHLVAANHFYIPYLSQSNILLNLLTGLKGADYFRIRIKSEMPSSFFFKLS